MVLKPNEDVIAPGLIVERRSANGLLTRDVHQHKGTFYTGHVASDPGSMVAVRETEKRGELVSSLVLLY